MLPSLFLSETTDEQVVAKANLEADERMHKIVAEAVAEGNRVANERHAKFYDEMRCMMTSVQRLAQIAISKIEASEDFVQCALEAVKGQDESETVLLDQLHMLGERKHQLLADLAESHGLVKFI
jgi:hypothetical protein